MLAAQLIAAGCSKKAAKIEPAYVSPTLYQHFDCGQIRQELVRVSTKVRQISGHQDDEAQKDAVALGVGLVLFWPALLFMAGDDRKGQIADLKGEYDALKEVAIQKDCDVATEIAEAERLEAERVAARKNKPVEPEESEAEGGRINTAQAEEEECYGTGYVSSIGPVRPWDKVPCS